MKWWEIWWNFDFYKTIHSTALLDVFLFGWAFVCFELVWLFIILSFTQSGSLQRKLYIEFDSINATSFGQGYMVIGVRAPSDLRRGVGAWWLSCQKKLRNASWGAAAPLAPQLVRLCTWSLFFNFLGGLPVQLWCVHIGYIVYPFSCNVTDVLIKHILAWLTKCTYSSKPQSVFNCLHAVRAKYV